MSLEQKKLNRRLKSEFYAKRYFKEASGLVWAEKLLTSEHYTIVCGKFLPHITIWQAKGRIKC